MRIDALVVVIGDAYEKMFERARKLWLDTCDDVHVIDVTRQDTTLTRYGATFNKGAVLSEAFTAIEQRGAPLDWILNVDADIIPPKNWRLAFEFELGHQPFSTREQKLYGADRYYESGAKIDDWPFPCGYFHLWNVRDHRTWRRPVYKVDCGMAANYDMTFCDQWPESERVRLPIRLIHQGEPRSSWYGIGTPEQDKRNAEGMKKLHAIGLRKVYTDDIGKLDVPTPERILHDGATTEEALVLLRELASADPFERLVVVKP